MVSGPCQCIWKCLLHSFLVDLHVLKFNSIPFKACKLLCIAENLAKVDVEHVTGVLQHDVVIVAVTDAQDKGGHAPASARVNEVGHSLDIQ